MPERHPREIALAAAELLGMTVDEFAELCRHEVAWQLRTLADRIEDGTPTPDALIDIAHWLALADAAEAAWEDRP
jgi:hypothetical protein